MIVSKSQSVQKLATSSLVGLPQQRSSKSGAVLASRALQSGLATSTRPGRSGPDTRPGMVTLPQRKTSVMVPVPTNVPKEALPTVDVPVSSPSIPIPISSGVSVTAAPPVVRPRVIPQSLFLTADNSSSDSPLPSIHSSSNVDQAGVVTSLVPDNDNPDLHESSIDDSPGPSEENHDFGNDLDGLPQTDNDHLHAPSQDDIPSNPRDPTTPCAVTFGPAYDLHETHQGVLTDNFENCFSFPVGSETVHLPPGYDDGRGVTGPIVADPLLTPSQHSSLPVPPIPLRAHKDDSIMLSTEDKTDHQYFECRIAFLCTHWNTFHS